jgi:hypothetical protein
MKSAMATLFTASLISVGALVGCDREVSKTTTVKDGPGSTKIEEKKVTEKADGTVEQKTEVKKIDK